MIIHPKSKKGKSLTDEQSILAFALLRFMNAVHPFINVMHDDIRHKPIHEAFENAIKAFNRVGVDVILVDEEVQG